MADSDKDIIITPNTGQASSDPNIEFSSGASVAGNPISLTVTDDGTTTTLDFSGNDVGQLFSISNTLDGNLFTVSDTSGIPLIAANSDATVKLNEFAGNLLIGTSTDDGTNKVQISGNAIVSGSFSAGSLDYADITNLPSPKITLGGDLSGSVILTTLTSGTLTASINPNSVALGTDTTGNYVSSVAQGSAISVTGTAGEGATFTVNHADTSSVADVNGSNGTVVQDLTFDTYGHVQTTGTINLDTRYYTETEVQSFFERGYISSCSVLLSSGAGWYTIAVVPSNLGSAGSNQRAVAKFAAWTEDSGDHVETIFYATHLFGTDNSNSINVVSNSSYNNTQKIQQIRILEKSVYDGAMLQIYATEAFNLNFAILGDNFLNAGWELCNPQEGTLPTNLAANANFTFSSYSQAAIIDLNDLDEGGIGNSGNISARGFLKSIGGQVHVGAANSISGTLMLYGQGSGSAEGGEIRIFPTGGYPGNDFWAIDSYADNLRIFRDIGTGAAGFIETYAGIVPASNYVYDLGSSTKHFNAVYARQISFNSVANGVSKIVGNANMSFYSDASFTFYESDSNDPRIVMDVNNNVGRIGLGSSGNAAPAYPLDIYNPISATQADTYGIYLQMPVSGSSTPTGTDTIIGNLINLDYTQTASNTGGNIIYLWGIYSDVDITGSGNPKRVRAGNYSARTSSNSSYSMNELYGTYVVAEADGGSNLTVSNAIGAYNLVDMGGLNKVTQASGSRNIVIKNTGSNAVLATAYGTYNYVDNRAGTITTSYATRSYIGGDSGAIFTNSYLFHGNYSSTPTYSNSPYGIYLQGPTAGNAELDNVIDGTIRPYSNKTGNIGSASFNWDNVYADQYWSNNSGTRNKYMVWSGTEYAIGMDNSISFGGLNEYAMTFQMNNNDLRGFWWGDTNHSDAQGAMSLTTDGRLAVARSAQIGLGENSITAASSTSLEVHSDSSNNYTAVFTDSQNSARPVLLEGGAAGGHILTLKRNNGLASNSIINVNFNSGNPQINFSQTDGGTNWTIGQVDYDNINYIKFAPYSTLQNEPHSQDQHIFSTNHSWHNSNVGGYVGYGLRYAPELPGWASTQEDSYGFALRNSGTNGMWLLVSKEPGLNPQNSLYAAVTYNRYDFSSSDTPSITIADGGTGTNSTSGLVLSHDGTNSEVNSNSGQLNLQVSNTDEFVLTGTRNITWRPLIASSGYGGGFGIDSNTSLNLGGTVPSLAKHWLTTNDGHGNFNLRVGHRSVDIGSGTYKMYCTEEGFPFHDKWNHEGNSNSRQFLVAAQKYTAAAEITSWYTQMQYSSNNVLLSYRGSTKLSTLSDGVDITGKLYCDDIDVNGESLITGNVTGTLFADVIAANLIQADMIEANAITASKIQANAVTANELQISNPTGGSAGIYMDYNSGNSRIDIRDTSILRVRIGYLN